MNNKLLNLFVICLVLCQAFAFVNFLTITNVDQLNDGDVSVIDSLGSDMFSVSNDFSYSGHVDYVSTQFGHAKGIHMHNFVMHFFKTNSLTIGKKKENFYLFEINHFPQDAWVIIAMTLLYGLVFSLLNFLSLTDFSFKRWWIKRVNIETTNMFCSFKNLFFTGGNIYD